MVPKRGFSAQFRVQAVRLMKERMAAGVSLQRVGQELEINPERIRRWAGVIDAAPADAAPEQIFPGKGRSRSYQPRQIQREEEIGPESPEQELKRLRRENERLRQERDFLKKAAAFFAKESR